MMSVEQQFCTFSNFVISPFVLEPQTVHPHSNIDHMKVVYKVACISVTHQQKIIFDKFLIYLVNPIFLFWRALQNGDINVDVCAKALFVGSGGRAS